MTEATERPWQQGYLLSTPETRTWPKERQEQGNQEERRRVFSNFTVADQGRSRIFVCECQDEDTAALVVRAVNRDHHVAPLMEALDRLMVVGSAATGRLMCNFADMHEYVEEIMGRPVYTHEMGSRDIADEIAEKAKGDFVEAITAALAALAAAREAAS